MKQSNINDVVEKTCEKYDLKTLENLKRKVENKKDRQLFSEERLREREVHLKETEGRISPTAKERILGVNDLVDINYLLRGIRACKSVCRIILRDESFREVGYGTGFKVSPNLVLTNHHVFNSQEVAEQAIIEFDFELDQSGNPKQTTRFSLLANSYFISNEELDYALVAIAQTPVFGNGRLEDYGFLRLNPQTGKINVGEFATIIQHPSGQPKQVALRENELLEIDETTLLYQSDTAPGSSGSPVLNDSWQVVGLHHSGVPKKDSNGNWLLKNGEIASHFDDDADIDWIANAGIRASRIVKHVLEEGPKDKLKDEFINICEGKIIPSSREGQMDSTPIPIDPALDNPLQSRVSNLNSEQTTVNLQSGVDIPIFLSINVGDIQVKPWKQGSSRAKIRSTSTGLFGGLEKTIQPFHETNYSNRKGYNSSFLGPQVPMPIAVNKRNLSEMKNGSILLPYEHFSIINHKKRKLALFTASNIDASLQAKRPEPGKAYSRAGLSGLGKNDREKWFIDPRIPEEDQLSDEFYNKDRKAFDKGHLVQRNEVAWGIDYNEVRRANGDTYHITNCSPQVSNFNRSNLKGVWGSLENNIMRQAKREKYCVFCGPILKESDPVFNGINQQEGIKVQIPRAYWKIVTAVTDSEEIQSFAFLLTQDLGQTPFEFDVEEEWQAFMISINDLEKITTNIVFPKVIKAADQFKTLVGEELRNSNELMGFGVTT